MARIYERQTDALFPRALLKNPAFAAIFLTAVDEASENYISGLSTQTPHHGAGQGGSIDLEITLSNGKILLLENKIDAGWSVTRNGETQPDRYRATVAALRERGIDARSVLVAPQAYLNGSRHAAVFDAQVSYEALATALDGMDATVIWTAIRQAETPYEPSPNARTGDFFADYSALVSTEFPSLALKANPNGKGTRPTGSRTFYFDAKHMLHDHAGVPRPRISVQAWDSSAPMASAKFMIGGWGLLADKQSAPASLDAIGAYLRPAGRSLGLAIDTPHLNKQRLLGEQIDDVRHGLAAIDALRLWWNKHGAEMAKWRQEALED